MQILCAKYRIVTPLFIGDANQTIDDGIIRPPAIKGILRFWWRALNWGHYWKATQNEAAALKQLHQEEQRLFGAAMDTKNKTGGQGCFLLSVEGVKNPNFVQNWPPNSANHGSSYMAYGLLETQQEFHRRALVEGQEFTLKLLFKPNHSKCRYPIEKYKQQLKEVLQVWSLLGGLGSRSRRAMGSVTLVKLNDQSMLLQHKEYNAKIEQLFNRFKNIPTAPFTAFSKTSHYHIFHTGNNARHLVETMGQSYKTFRKEEVSLQDKISFGLPLQGVDENNRRSSPLFFHIQELSYNKFASTLFVLPSNIFHYKKHYRTISFQPIQKYLSKGVY